MKTSVIEVRDMLSVLSVLGVEQRIGEVPGVESVTVNFSAASATVRYDETRLDIADIKSAVRQRAYEADAAPTASAHGGGGEHHAAPGGAGAPAATPDPAAAKAPAGAAVAAKAASAGTAPQDSAAPSSLPKPATDTAATAPAAAAGAEQTAQAKPGKS